MRFKILSFLAVLLLALSALTNQLYAKGGADDPAGDDRGGSSGSNSDSSQSQDDSGVKHESKNEVRGQEPEAEVRGSANKLKAEHGVEVKNQVEAENENQVEPEFEIKGIVNSVADGSFVVSGQRINIDPTKVNNFQKTIDLAIGKEVKIEGAIIDGALFAREIKPLVENNSQKNSKSEVEIVQKAEGNSNSKNKSNFGSVNDSIFAKIVSLLSAFLKR